MKVGRNCREGVGVVLGRPVGRLLLGKRGGGPSEGNGVRMERGQISKAAPLWGLCVLGSKTEAEGPTSVSAARTWHPAFYPQHAPGALHANGEGKICGRGEKGRAGTWVCGMAKEWKA